MLHINKLSVFKTEEEIFRTGRKKRNITPDYEIRNLNELSIITSALI